MARAAAQHLTERTLFTELGVFVGTPEYMSPEQAEMGGLDIDTRADIMSLKARMSRRPRFGSPDAYSDSQT